MSSLVSSGGSGHAVYLVRGVDRVGTVGEELEGAGDTGDTAFGPESALAPAELYTLEVSFILGIPALLLAQLRLEEEGGTTPPLGFSPDPRVGLAPEAASLFVGVVVGDQELGTNPSEPRFLCSGGAELSPSWLFLVGPCGCGALRVRGAVEAAA